MLYLAVFAGIVECSLLLLCRGLTLRSAKCSHQHSHAEGTIASFTGLCTAGNGEMAMNLIEESPQKLAGHKSCSPKGGRLKFMLS